MLDRVSAKAPSPIKIAERDQIQTPLRPAVLLPLLPPSFTQPVHRAPNVLASLGGRLRPAVLGAVAGALLFCGTANVARAQRIDPPAPRDANVLVVPGRNAFDPARELVRFGVQPIRLGPVGFDPNRALTTSADGKTLSFSYPNRSDPEAPTKIHIVEYSNWDPAASTSSLSVADPDVMRWLKSHEVGSANNYENTDFEALDRWARRYLDDHRGELKKLGIRDVHHLTPKQAANLAGLMTARVMRYDNTAIRFGGNLFHPEMKAAIARLARIDPDTARRIEASLPKDVPLHVREMDEIGLDRLVATKKSKDNPKAETGVCRNSTEMFQGLFSILQRMQTPETSLLENTYVKMPSGQNHIWIALYTVEPDRTLTVAELDPTWPARDTDAGAIAAALDRPVAERAFFAVCHMQLAMNGTNRLGTDQDYDLLKLVALDLAARGRAEDGARLLVHYVRDLPDALRHNWIYLLNGGPAQARSEFIWHFPGERALFDALEPMLPSLR